MKKSNFLKYVTIHKAEGVVYLIAAILYSIYQFYSPLNQFVGFALMMVIPTMWIFAVIPWIVAGMLCAAIAIIFWLAGIRNNIIAALVGFSVSYFLISLTTTLIEAPAFIEIAIGVIVAYVIFACVTRLMSRVSVGRTPSIAMGVICLALLLYLTPVVTYPINAQRATTKANATFGSAVEALNFLPYYPTYSSSIYPASSAKLNGYDSAYSNETVTFMLGDAQVKQGGYLNGQDKVMNFIDNCTIYRLWSSLEDEGATIRQDDIDQSLEHPQECNLIRTTPTGKKVYFNDDGQWVRFYVRLNQTNLIIDFDNINGRKYDPSHLEELLKIIDSLQPLDKSKIEEGNSYGNGFSS